MCEVLHALHTLTQLMDFNGKLCLEFCSYKKKHQRIGASKRAVSWELPVVRAVPIVPSIDLFHQLMQLFDKLSLHAGCVRWEESVLILPISMSRKCWIFTEKPHLFLCWSHLKLTQSTQRCCWKLSYANWPVLQLAGKGQFLSLLHWNKHTSLPIVPCGRVTKCKEGVREPTVLKNTHKLTKMYQFLNLVPSCGKSHI